MPKVLIIDDIKDNLISLSALLKALIPDITLFTAQSGEEGIRKTLEENPDTILLDIQMPEMNGFEVCQKLKSNRRTWRIPIILITAIKTDAKSRILGLETGADAFLSKPIDEGELAAQVKAMLRIRHSEQLLSKEKDLLEELVVERTQKMKESEKYYETILESIEEDILILGPDYTIKDINRSFLETTGYTRKEVLGHFCYEISHNYDSPCSMHGEICLLDKVFETGKFEKSQHIHKTKDSTDISVDILHSPLTNEKGEVELVIETIRDISDLVKAQTRLDNERERAEKYLQLAPVLFVALNDQGTVNLINKKGCDILGYKESEIVGQNWFDKFISKKIKDEVKGVFKKLMKGEIDAVEYYENPILNKRGEERIIAFHNSPIKNDKGQIIGTLSSGEDITSRILAKESLKKNGQKLREYSKTLEKSVEERTKTLYQALENTETAKDRIDAIIKSVSSGIIVTDTHHRIILMNYAAEKLLDIRFSDVINVSIYIALKEKTLAEQFKTTIKEKPGGYQFDFKMKGKDHKKSYILQANTSVIFDKDKTKSGVVMVFHDVTKERELDRMKTDFLTTAAHELRTPLTSIQGFSEILLTKEGLATKDKKKYLTYINNQALVLSELIHDLLDLSRIESGLALTFKIDKYKGDELIRQILSFYKDQYPQYKFEFNLPQKPIYIQADHKKIKQVLKNLLDNAVKYSPVGSNIHIEGVVQDSFFQISIQDNGIGMTLKQARQIFNKFYRANYGNTQPSGTGLGLTIVKYIVEKHRGKVWADSKIARGTTVSFTIPLWKPSSK